MRIYRDVELVESLGSGIPRILRAYGEDCFKFTDNFIRITLPISAHDHASDHASVQVEKLVSIYSTYHKIKRKYHFCILYDRLRRTFFISPKRLGYRSRGWYSEEIGFH